MKVFIDTNILLDIYLLSGPDLEELRKLRRMIEKGKIELLVCDQVMDEFWRNRERVIADALKMFRDSKAAPRFPNMIRHYKKYKELKSLLDAANELMRDLNTEVMEDIEKDALMADKVLKELFGVITVSKVGEKVLSAARRRVELGNPPGKRDSIGDAVNWEWLLRQDIAPQDSELVLISADADFESELSKGRPREYLLKEWENQNKWCALKLEKSLTSFFSKYFPGIQLAEEIDKVEAIEKLENSFAFATTHSAISTLSQYDDFKDSEVRRLISAILDNNQVLWILGDADVKAFASKLVTLAKAKETKELAGVLIQTLEELEPDYLDIPF